MFAWPGGRQELINFREPRRCVHAGKTAQCTIVQRRTMLNALYPKTRAGEKHPRSLFSRLSLLLLARFASIYLAMASVNMTNPDANNGDVKLITSLLGRHQGELLSLVSGKASLADHPPVTADFPVKDILFLDIFPIRELFCCFDMNDGGRCNAEEDSETRCSLAPKR